MSPLSISSISLPLLVMYVITSVSHDSVFNMLEGRKGSAAEGTSLSYLDFWAGCRSVIEQLAGLCQVLVHPQLCEANLVPIPHTPVAFLFPYPHLNRRQQQSKTILSSAKSFLSRSESFPSLVLFELGLALA